MTTLELSKPLQHGIETISRLEINEPTFAEIKKLGLPIATSTKEVKMDIVFEYLAALAVQPAPILDKMCARDAMAATAVIVGFFSELKV